MAIGTPAVLTENGSTADGTGFATASVTSPSGGLLVLFLSVASVGTTPDVTPTVSGLGSWTLAGQIGDGVMAARAFTAPATATTSAVTIDYSPSVVEAVVWHLIHIPGADGVGQPAGTIGTTLQSPTWSLPSAPAVSSATLFVGAINGSGATITPGGTSVGLGSEQDQTSPSLSSRAMWLDPATQEVSYTSSAASLRKVGISLEITEAATVAPTTAWYKTGGTRVPLIARTHTYLQRAIAAPAGLGASPLGTSPLGA